VIPHISLCAGSAIQGYCCAVFVEKSTRKCISLKQDQAVSETAIHASEIFSIHDDSSVQGNCDSEPIKRQGISRQLMYFVLYHKERSCALGYRIPKGRQRMAPN